MKVELLDLLSAVYLVVEMVVLSVYLRVYNLGRLVDV